MSAPNPFRFLDAVCDTKVDLFSEGAEESEYTPFLINRGLSYHLDTALYAGEINSLSLLPNRLQHDYYLHGLRKRKRWAKWSKKDVDRRDEEMVIAKTLNISSQKASEIHDLFSHEQINKMKEKLQL